MSGTDYIADTNALINLLSGDSCMEPFLDSRFGVSVISEMELLSYPGISVEEEKSIRELLDDCIILPLDDMVKDRVVELRRAYKVKLSDAIIAATALLQERPLLTADSDF
ncbi:MAG: type II toxin-antitoxin system VapC family toxin, partial [Eggerthellaceae bacterium]|nr:type II toxin-antitoxin system VapC family toxin [Eggerthellaceae bacterium]